MLRRIGTLFMGVVTLLAYGATVQAEAPVATACLLPEADDLQPTPGGCPEGGLPSCDPCGRGDGLGEFRYGPRWTVTADAVFLARRIPAATLIVDALDQTEVLSSSAFDFSSHAGFEVSLSRRLGCDNGIEFRYLGVDRWGSDVSLPTVSGRNLEINADDRHVFTAAGTSLDAYYASQLHSCELNGRHEFCQRRLAVLAGFRYTELDEGWGFTLVGATPPFRLEANTRNRLYGFQLGGQAALLDRGGPLSVDAYAKAGIYGNRAAQDSFYATDVATLSAHGARTSTAFLGELGLAGTYRITERFSVRGGYRLLWIDGVALAPAQLAASEFVTGQGIPTSDGAFYHGAFLGFEFVR